MLDCGANFIIDNLISKGYEAYAVGGAVRDMLLNKPFSDIDITTSATPDKVMEIFSRLTVIPTGLKHGTVTVLYDGKGYEVTTYRSEKGYSDNRRPDEVSFVSDLKEDLKRRDFTINAIAYNEREGIKDYYGGQADLKAELIRGVGNPDTRFKEDALRILRGVRFSSTLGFEIEAETKRAIFENKSLIKNVASERIQVELVKLLLGKNASYVLNEYKEVIFEFIPELKACDGFSHNSKYHSYDVFGHIVKSIEYGEKNKDVMLALLFHDIGKPLCYSESEKGVGRFIGHQDISAEIARKVLNRLRFDSKTVSNVYVLVKQHDRIISPKPLSLKKLLNKVGLDLARKLIAVRYADAMSHNVELCQDRIAEIKKTSEILEEIVKRGDCYSLKRLQISGNELVKIGFKGEQIKDELNALLLKVMEGTIENERAVLTESAVKDYDRRFK